MINYDERNSGFVTCLLPIRYQIVKLVLYCFTVPLLEILKGVALNYKKTMVAKEAFLVKEPYKKVALMVQ